MTDDASPESATLRTEAREPAPIRRLRLLGPSGEMVGDLSEPRSSIGQLPSNDVVLADRSVSRFHCEILLEHGQARVHDLESRNGTWLDRTRVVEAFLADGAE